MFHFLRWFIIIKHDLYLSFQASLVHHHWAWFVLFYYTLHWFFLTGHGLHCFTSCFTDSFLLGIVCIISLPSLVQLYWAWLVLFTSRFTGSFFYWAWSILFHLPHWFIINGHDVYFVTSLTDSSLLACLCSSNSHLTGSSLLGMVCIVSIHALLVLPYWSMLVLIHFSHWFIITGHGLFCSTSCFTGSSSLGMVCIAWLRASLVLHYWAWFVLFHFMLDWLVITSVVLHYAILHLFIVIGHGLLLFHDMFHWFIIAGHGLYCLTTRFTGSSLLGMVCIVPLRTLVHHY